MDFHVQRPLYYLTELQSASQSLSTSAKPHLSLERGKQSLDMYNLYGRSAVIQSLCSTSGSEITCLIMMNVRHGIHHKPLNKTLILCTP